MTGNSRRIKVLEMITNTNTVISATKIAIELGVSRQIIVGDVALLRASGENIVATARGYKIVDTANLYQIDVKHSAEEASIELGLLVEMNVKILDISIDHPQYGIIKGDLNIETPDDITTFINKKGNALLSLTDGFHRHTIECESDEHFEEVVLELRKLNFIM